MCVCMLSYLGFIEILGSATLQFSLNLKSFEHCFFHYFFAAPLLSSVSGTPVVDVRPLGRIPQATTALCSLSVIFSLFVFHFLCMCVSFG